MSRQIIYRNGSESQHNSFVGAPAEITVDTTNWTLHVHDGTTPGGHTLARADEIIGNGMPTNADYVIETQLPTAENNYTWYRKYAYGWVEQGGQSQSQNITLPVEMSDNNYCIQLCGHADIGNNNVRVHAWRDVTTTGFVTQCNILNGFNSSAPANESIKYWYVSGWAAQTNS